MNKSAVAVVSIMLKVELINHNQEIENIGEILSQIKLKGQAMASPQMAEQVELQNIDAIGKDYLSCIGSLTAPCYKENVVWMVLALPVMVSKQAVDRMKELRYGGEKSYKTAFNVRKKYSFGDSIVFSPAQVRYNNCFENLSNLMFQEYGKSFDGEFERLKIVSDTDNAADDLSAQVWCCYSHDNSIKLNYNYFPDAQTGSSHLFQTSQGEACSSPALQVRFFCQDHCD